MDFKEMDWSVKTPEKAFSPDDKGSDLAEDPVKVAEALNLDLVVPESDELFIDLDKPDDKTFLISMLSVLSMNGWVVTNWRETRSKSGNMHVYLRAPRPLTDLERILLQACLGSDRKRELLSFLRIETNVDRPPTVFFEVKP